MKGKSHILVQIILGILLFVLLFFSVYEKSNNTVFNKVTYSDQNHVFNKTENTFLDTITLAGMNTLHIKNTSVLIAPLLRNEVENNLELKGYITQTDGGYIIFIKNTDRLESIEILSHELVHMNQLYSGRLKNTKNTVTFDKIVYDSKSLPEYLKRPWEMEAFSKQKEIQSQIIKELYQ